MKIYRVTSDATVPRPSFREVWEAYITNRVECPGCGNREDLSDNGQENGRLSFCCETCGEQFDIGDLGAFEESAMRCGHSRCSQNYIETGDAACIEAHDIDCDMGEDCTCGAGDEPTHGSSFVTYRQS